MTYEQYWYDDPRIAGAFRKAEKLRQEREDTSAWLHGIYFARAIEATIGNAFREKGSPPAKYPELPLLAEEKERKRVSEEQEAAFAKMWMMQFCEAGKDWGKKDKRK